MELTKQMLADQASDLAKRLEAIQLLDEDNGIAAQQQLELISTQLDEFSYFKYEVDFIEKNFSGDDMQVVRDLFTMIDGLSSIIYSYDFEVREAKRLEKKENKQ